MGQAQRKGKEMGETGGPNPWGGGKKKRIARETNKQQGLGERKRIVGCYNEIYEYRKYPHLDSTCQFHHPVEIAGTDHLNSS